MKSAGQKIAVEGNFIALLKRENNFFINLTDVVSALKAEGDAIEKWLRKESTLAFLTLWEKLHNPAFNAASAAAVSAAILKNPLASVARPWAVKTAATGILIKAGPAGGIFAHPDIAFEVASWLNLEFKVLLVAAFESFKQQATTATRGNWDLQRRLSKANYKMQARAVKETILPTLSLPKGEEGPVYAEEGDMLNLAVFGKTSQQWKEENSNLARKGLNIRDTADLSQLTVLSNLASYNALLIQQRLPKETRLSILESAAVVQLQSLRALAHFPGSALQSPHAKEAA